MVETKTWDAQKGGSTQRYILPWMRAWYAGQNFITAGTIADCIQACTLVEEINAENLLADKGYDSDEFIDSLVKEGINPVIPPRKNRKNPRHYDKYLYRFRHLVENAFLELKRWRGIATRYAKNTASFLAAVHIRCIAIWAKIYCRHYLVKFKVLTNKKFILHKKNMSIN